MVLTLTLVGTTVGGSGVATVDEKEEEEEEGGGGREDAELTLDKDISIISRGVRGFWMGFGESQGRL